VLASLPILVDPVPRFSEFVTDFLQAGPRKQQLFYIADAIFIGMESRLRFARRCGMALLVALVVAHGNLTADLTGKAPNPSGMTRLERDLSRRPGTESVRSQNISEWVHA
jgi:hypothetical protein